MDVVGCVKLYQRKVAENIDQNRYYAWVGETHDELLQTFRDVADRGVDILTLGQYLNQPKIKLMLKNIILQKNLKCTSS